MDQESYSGGARESCWLSDPGGSSMFGLVWINRDRVSGTPCFYGTRVPIKTLFDSLAAGQTLEQFLDDFEGVSREQAEAILELAGSHLLDDLPKP